MKFQAIYLKLIWLKILLLTLFLYLAFSATTLHAKNKPIVELISSAQQVWQRQQVLITLKVKTDDPFSRLEVDDFNQKGFSIIPFEQQRIENKGQTLLTLKWGVFPFAAGNHKLELPRIRYRPNSGRIQTLALQDLSLKVRRLPIYVPPTMPVGDISLQSKWDEGWLVTTNNLLEWQVIIMGKGVAKQTMPPLTRQLNSTKELQVLPIQNSIEMLKSEQGITNKSHYAIPLKAIKSGSLNLPAVAVQYFEPISGKLQTAHLSPPFVISTSLWLLSIIGFVVIATIIFLLIYLVTFLKVFLKKSAQRKQALRQLKQAEDYKQIRNALKQYGLAQGWENNLSLSSFSVLWEQKFGKNPLLLEAIQTLQSDQFSETSNVKIRSTSQKLYKALSRSK